MGPEPSSKCTESSSGASHFLQSFLLIFLIFLCPFAAANCDGGREMGFRSGGRTYRWIPPRSTRPYA
jgi:hypothetical protein